jgi:hypothetical protein
MHTVKRGDLDCSTGICEVPSLVIAGIVDAGNSDSHPVEQFRIT